MDLLAIFPEGSRPGPCAVALLESPWAMPTSTSKGLLEMCCPANSTVTYKRRAGKWHVSCNHCFVEQNPFSTWKITLGIISHIFNIEFFTHLVHACHFGDIDNRVGTVLVIVGRHFSLNTDTIVFKWTKLKVEVTHTRMDHRPPLCGLQGPPRKPAPLPFLRWWFPRWT